MIRDLHVGGAVVAVESFVGEDRILPDLAHAGRGVGGVELHEFREAVVGVPETAGEGREGGDGEDTGQQEEEAAAPGRCGRRHAQLLRQGFRCLGSAAVPGRRE